MSLRADHVDETRQRIVEATVRLHQRVGLRATTISAVADEAGVTRVTVYRHFPGVADLVAACSAHWLARQRRPDPATWSSAVDLATRLRAGLTDVYRFYRAGADMLTWVSADVDVLPEPIRAARVDQLASFVDALAEPIDSSARNPVVRAALSHAVSFGTWRSLCLESSLSDDEAVDAMSTMVAALVGAQLRRHD